MHSLTATYPVMGNAYKPGIRYGASQSPEKGWESQLAPFLFMSKAAYLIGYAIVTGLWYALLIWNYITTL